MARDGLNAVRARRHDAMRNTARAMRSWCVFTAMARRTRRNTLVGLIHRKYVLQRRCWRAWRLWVLRRRVSLTLYSFAIRQGMVDIPHTFITPHLSPHYTKFMHTILTDVTVAAHKQRRAFDVWLAAARARQAQDNTLSLRALSHWRLTLLSRCWHAWLAHHTTWKQRWLALLHHHTALERSTLHRWLAYVQDRARQREKETRASEYAVRGKKYRAFQAWRACVVFRSRRHRACESAMGQARSFILTR